MTDPAATQPEKSERIAKRLSRAGICSRREAERWIAEGRVRIDGVKITTPATLVTAASQILVDGKKVAEPERTRLWRYHKPDGLVCSTSDQDGRKTIFEKLPAALPRVMTVGRLDLRSEGLLLLTNDGELARRLELPATGWTRRYRVRVFGNPTEEGLSALANGISIDNIRYGAIHARIDSQRGDNAWLSVSLQEGKNREIRRVMEHLGFRVNRLIRIGYGPFQLGKLERGEVQEVPARVVAEQTGGEIKPRLKGKPARTKPPVGDTRPGKPPARKPASRTAGSKTPKPKTPGPKNADRRRPA